MFGNFMLKYGCYCINCHNQTAKGTCSVEHVTCDSNYKKGGCPITKCMMFIAKEKPAENPCVYFDRIEKSGLSMLI